MPILESVKGVFLQNLMMSVTETLLCTMSAINARGLLMLCDSAVVKTGPSLYYKNCVTFSPSTALLTGHQIILALILPVQLGKSTAFAKGKGTRWENLLKPRFLLPEP